MKFLNTPAVVRLFVSISLLLCFSIQAYSFQYETKPYETKPYEIKVDGELLRFIGNFEDHSLLNFTNLEEGEIYILQYLPPLNSSEVFLHKSNVEILEEEPNVVKFIAQKNNIFNFNWYYPTKLSEVVITVSPFEKLKYTTQNQVKSSSNLSINSGVSIPVLVDSLISGSCFQVFDITSNGAAATQYGTFSGGMPSIGIDKGIVLTNGNVNSIPGINTQAWDVSNYVGGPQDVDLTDIANVTTKDAATIEFKFIPTVDTVQFKFVWASEEYCIWSSSNYTDVCGFFVSGPGINGVYTNNSQNFAVSPVNGAPINVNLFNHYNHSSPDYVSNNTQAINDDDYLDSMNCLGPPAHPVGSASTINEIKFNAFSGVFDAIIPVIPCSTYTIKIAVADGHDNFVDSGFFIQGNSWNQGEPVIVEAINADDLSNEGYEGCGTYYYEFCKDPETPISEEYTVNFALSSSSTAAPGADFDPLPTSVVIPSGVQCVQVPIVVNTDSDNTEGPETIVIDVDDPCNCSSTEVTFIINDLVPISSNTPDQGVCGSGTLDLVVNPTGGAPPYTYNWNTGQTSSTINVGAGTYTVTITDDCGQTTSESINVNSLEEPTATISGGGTICPNSGASVPIEISFTGSGPWDFTYQQSGETPVQITGNTANPFIIQGDTIGSWFLTDFSDPVNNCTATILNSSVVISEGSLTINETVTDPLCNGTSSGSISLTPAGGSGSYSYTWSNGGNTATISNLPAGTYSVTVNDNNSVCEGIETYTLTEPPAITASFGSTPFIDCNNSTGTISVTAGGGSGTSYGYSWTTTSPQGIVVSGATNSTVTVGGPGTYDVQITDSNSCQESFSVVVSGDLSDPTAAIATPIDLDCAITATQLDGTLSSSPATGTGLTYFWTTSNGTISDPTSSMPTVTHGTYLLEVTEISNGCTDTVSVTVNNVGALPTLIINTPNQIDCANTTEVLNALGSSSGSNISISWSPAGNITDGATTLTPTVNAGGTYTLTLEDSSNGCVDSLSVFVPEDLTNPTVDVGANTMLDCNNASITLGGPTTSTGANFTQTWTDSAGNIISNNPTVDVTIQDTYMLTVFDSNNGCSDMQSIIVTQDTISPTVFAAPAGPSIIDCNNAVVTITGAGSSVPPNITYQWNTPDGNIFGTDALIDVDVNAEGSYNLTVTNTLNGCQSTSSNVFIGQDTISPLANAGSPAEITCDSTTITLNGSGSSGPNITYLWTTTTGFIVSDSTTLNPVVSQAGTYNLTVTDNSNGCDAMSSVIVTSSQNLPTVSIIDPSDITCLNTSVLLDASGSSGGLTYSWQDPSDVVISTSDTVTVSSGGTYTFSITDSGSGCTSVDSVIVDIDITLPIIQFDTPEDITCSVMSVDIDGANSSGGDQYTWTTNDGTINSGANSDIVNVGSEGTYTLTLINLATGCQDSSSIDVVSDTISPIAVASTLDSITCVNTQVMLDADGSSEGSDITYFWTTIDGQILLGEGTQTPFVTSGGTYDLLVTDDSNGCDANASVFVFSDTIAPLADAGLDTAITCSNPSIELDGTGSDIGPDLVYLWTTSDGNIANGAATLNPEVDLFGTYLLTVTNNINGCIDTSSVFVDQNNIVPVSDAGVADDLNCENLTVGLDGSSNSTPNAIYLWYTLDGQIVDGGNTLTPTVGEFGTYFLEVSDPSSGCADTSSVIVYEYDNQPTASVSTPFLITCDDPIVLLDGSMSSQGPNISYSWTTNDGNIVASTTLDTAHVDLSGTYTLTVTDDQSLCKDSTSIFVDGNSDVPLAFGLATGDWDCSGDLIGLSGSSDISNVSWQWIALDGNITTPNAAQQNVEADTSGTYILAVLNNANLCIGYDTVFVLDLVVIPSVTINDPGPINCSNPTVDISLDVTNIGTDTTYLWETTDGSIISSAAENTITVDSAGTYDVIVTNPFNFCSTEASITITENSVYPTAVGGPSDTLTCSSPDYTLNATGTSTGPNYSYNWTTPDGNIVSGDTTLMPLVDMEGSYILAVFDSASLCESKDTVEVFSNQVDPDSEAGTAAVWDCTTTELTLSGSTTTVGNITTVWTTTNGSIMSGDSTLTPIIDNPGTYYLTVTDLDNGCSGLDSLEIIVDAGTPIADAGSNQVINCSGPTVELNGSGSSTGSQYIQSWTTTGGNIVSGDTTLTPIVDAAGTYTIEVTNTDNGCSIQSNVVVVMDTIIPDVDASFTGLVNCYTPTLILDGAGTSTGSDYTYQWSTTNGNIDSGITTLSPTISAGGDYTLTVVDTLSTCTDSLTIQILEDLDEPISVAGDSMMITCTDNEVTLMGGNSSAGPDIIYQWTSPTGSIVSGDDSTSPVVNTEGDYILTVTDTVNGCFNVDSTFVGTDADIPIAIAGLDSLIDCTNPNIQLDGAGSSSGANIEYLWTTSNGNIVSGDSTLNPTINAGGDYTLEVTDNSNGCKLEATVSIVDNTQLPTVTASAPGIVDCYTPTLMLDGTGSSTGSDFDYQWTTSGGQIDSGGTTLDPIISLGGNYTLIVTNTATSCQDSVSLVVTDDLNYPVVEAGDSSLITCTITEVTLDGSSSDSGSDISYEWTTDTGSFVSSDTLNMVSVNGSGTYYLTVTNSGNGCTSSDSTYVELDSNVPTANAGPDLILDCDNPISQLDGTGSTIDSTIIYVWTTMNGNILSGDSTLTPIVDAEGDYSLMVIDTTNGCEIESEVMVTDDTDLPVVAASVPGIIDCFTPTLSLDGAGSSTGSEYTYLWTTSNGNINSGANSLNPDIDLGGEYTLLITDTLSNCKDSIAVTVGQDNDLPMVDVGPDAGLDCATTTMSIDGSNSSNGADFTYLWTTVDGNITGVNDSLVIEIDSGGVYVLTISNTVNGCVDSAAVTIAQDFNVPQVMTDPGGEINCVVSAIPLVGQVTSNTTNLVYDWQFNGGGSISSGQGTLNAEAIQPDMYFLVVEDTVNNCVGIDSVLVTMDANVPSISILGVDTLDCIQTSIQIDATNSDQGPSIIFVWSGPFDSGTNTLSPILSTAGSYGLNIEDTITGCKLDAVFDVIQDTLTPGITFNSTALIDCYNSSIPIDAVISSSGTVDALWTAGTGGVIDGADTGLSINVSAASTYQLEITDLSNGCMNMETITVVDDLDNPILSAAVPDSISCPEPTDTLSAFIDTQGDSYIFGWATTTSGSIISGDTTLSPIVSGAAPYTITAQNTVNGCVDSLTIDVFGNLNLPTVTAQVTDSLDCVNLLVAIDGSGSSSTGTYDYTWLSSTGGIVSGQNSLIAEVNQPGDYTLIVEDLLNQCVDSTTVNVYQDIIDPTIALNSSAVVNCYSPIIPIDAVVTSSGTFSSQWAANSGGTIVGIDTTLSVDVSTAGTYELFILDNSNGCTSMDSIIVVENNTNPVLTAATPDSISCPQPNVAINAFVNTDSAAYTFTWLAGSSGTINSGGNSLNPIVSGAAPYTLTVQNTVNGCVDSLTIDVFGDLNLPTVTAQVNDSLDCVNLLVAIDGSGSSSTGTYDYTWLSSTGGIVSGQNSLITEVNQPGDYTLIVEDLTNQCVDSTTVNVYQDIIDPTIALNSSSIVNCYTPIIEVDATVTSNGAINAQWTSDATGTIVGTTTDLSIDVSSEGVYQILVTDSSNGCTSQDSIIVTENKSNPIIDIPQPDSITCPQPIVLLSATVNADNQPIDINWTTSSAGVINSGANTLNPSVSSAAPYTLTAQNLTNGCIDSLTVDVFGDLDLPAVTAQVSDFLSCSNTTVEIDGAGSASAGTYTYNWSAPPGSTVQGQGSLLIQVDEPGDYVLTIVDLSNSCVDSVAVSVDENIIDPITAIALPDTLNCGVTTVDLLGDAGANPSPTYVYSWSTSNGNIISPTNTLNVSADQTGTYTLEIFDSFNGCSSDSSVVVVQDTLSPVADAGSAQILDCNLTAQTLDGSLSSQGSIYSYQWSTVTGNIVNQASTINPEIDAPGTYEILVTNIVNQCTSQDQIIVDQQISPPLVEAGQNDTINCIQSTVQLSGTGSSVGVDFDYLWSSFDGNSITNQTQIDANVDIEGVYQLLVTDNSNGCSDSDIVIITIDTIVPVLSGQVPDILNCGLSDAILSVNSSVIGDVSYDWSTSSGNIVSGVNTANPIVNAAGVYDLQFVNLINGCQAQEQITVLQDTIQPTVDAGAGGTITCVQLDFTAQGTASTNSGQSTINWTSPNGVIDSGAGTLNPLISAPGLYIIEVIDPINACNNVDTVEVLINQVDPVISQLSSLTLDCNNVLVTIDGSATTLEPQYQLTWNTSNGNIVSGDNTLTPVVDQEGQYELSILDIDNGCSSSESVTIFSNFVYPDISAGTDIDLPCGVSVTSLQGTINGASTDLQILWNALNGNIVNGASTLTPTIDVGGTYAMSVVNTINGCESADTVSVLFDAPPVLSYLATDAQCAGDFGSLNITAVTGGTPPYVYSIDDGDNYSSSADFGFLAAGEYSVVAQDFNGCETDINVVTITEPPVFDVMVLDSVITYQEGEQAQIIADPSYPLSSITSILWTPSEGLSCIDCLDPVVSTQQSTTYVLELINANGCSTTVAIPVFVDKSANVFIANTFTPNSDGVNEVLMIMADVTNVKAVKRFEVYDRWGEQMFSRSNFPPNDPQYGWDGTFKGSLLNQGVFVYYVEVEMLDGRIELFKGDVFLSK